MRWPWQRQAEIRSSSYTDTIVSALTLAASGGGTKTALATAALGQCSNLYASALAACSVEGPPSIVRALDASWRAATAAALVRRGEAVYVIGASPVSGLDLQPVSHHDVSGGPDRTTWLYRLELKGPTRSAWRTVPADMTLHVRWLTDPDRPWAGVGPLPSDTGSLAGWLDKRLSEEVSQPVGALLSVAKSESDPDIDLHDREADPDLVKDPLGQLRRDLGRSRGQILCIESQIAAADSPSAAPRRDNVPVRFGANPPESVIALREKVELSVGAACGVPRTLLADNASAGALREAHRQFVSIAVDGLLRRLEAQLEEQLSARVRFDSRPLAGIDVLGRAAAFARLQNGGVPVAAARLAAGI